MNNNTKEEGGDTNTFGFNVNYDPEGEKGSSDTFNLGKWPGQENSQQQQSQQQQQQQNSHCYDPKMTPVMIDVWDHNFEDEMWKIMKVIEKYNVVGMDTEFPGIVYRPEESQYTGFTDFDYKTIKMNVDNLKMIQVGLSLSDDKGFLPNDTVTWQFNLKFDKDVDQIGVDSLSMLDKAGIKFDEHKRRGIDQNKFAEYLVGSGLLLNEDVKWICFHGGFDFGYLIKMVTGEKLPDDESQFAHLLTTYFPAFYDVKSMIKDIDSFKNYGLNKLSTELAVKRVGTPHQGGSDSLLTLSAYFKLKDTYFNKSTPETKFLNDLYGFRSRLDDFYNMSYYQEYSYMMQNQYGGMNPQMINQYQGRSESPYQQNYGNLNMYNGGNNMNYNMNMNQNYQYYGNPYGMESQSRRSNK